MFQIPALVFCASLLSSVAQAQEQCSSHTLTRRLLQAQGLDADLERQVREAHAGVRKGGGPATIPVAVHVVWNSAAENVADALINAMIATMDQDYQALNSDWDDVRPAFANDRGNPDIQFCLAQVDPSGNSTTGITRTQTTQTWFDPDTETDDMKSEPDGIAPWDPDRYLNIWICDISSGASGGLVTTGYAYLPFGNVVGSDIDGLVLDYDYGLGPGARTATHEVGHYLGLLHPWGEGGCGSDDGMDDTPVTDDATFSCANTSLMNCAVLTQYENFMDYADCSLMFTNDQAAQMNGILNGDRSGLLNNNACGNVTTGPCIPTSINGTGDGDYLDGVQLGDISNTGSGGVTGPTYEDYTSQGADLVRGQDYVMVATSGEYTEDIVGAWIDYDADGVFDAGELLGEAVTTGAFEDVSISFTVPMNAALGTTRLRVRCVYPDTDNGEPANADPCVNFSWGETEDYSVHIGTNTAVATSNGSAFALYPNPADDLLRIKIGQGGIQVAEVFDAQGRVVLRHFGATIAGGLDVGALANGQYLLRCTVDRSVNTALFTVQHTF